MFPKINGFATLALLSAFLALPIGCAADLQRDYVDSMEATRKAVEKDVEHGLYKPDAKSRKTLDEWKDANADADAVLKADGK